MQQKRTKEHLCAFVELSKQCCVLVILIMSFTVICLFLLDQKISIKTNKLCFSQRMTDEVQTHQTPWSCL